MGHIGIDIQLLQENPVFVMRHDRETDMQPALRSVSKREGFRSCAFQGAVGQR